MSVIAELSLFPMDKGESVSPFVARVVTVIKQSGLSYEFGPMGTTIEGAWDNVIATVSACYKALEEDCDRIYMTLKVDARKGRTNGLAGKKASVNAKL
ncbi:MAG: MTH1187 family thiamine-binding protein [Desulfovibrionales bacterium]|nr:MTH1187 family thiamine-binding protein [Desulfovibrionales bacterium]